MQRINREKKMFFQTRGKPLPGQKKEYDADQTALVKSFIDPL